MTAAGCEPATKDNLLLYCKTLPKVELHAHLNGSISDDTMYKLIKRKKRGANNLPETWETTIAKGQKRTMEECFQMFKIIHAIVDDVEAVSMVAHDVVKEFAADGVVYLELRSTPRANKESGMTKTSYIDSMIKGIESALATLTATIYVRLLLSIDRRQSPTEAMETVLLAEEYSRSFESASCPVIGIDLSGDPRAGDMTALLPVLKAVKEKNLKLAMHLSEIPARNEETLLLMKGVPPDRIGHGTFLHPDVGGTKEIVHEVTSSQIPIELCLSSNLKTQTVPSIESHHFQFWKGEKHPIVLCTDDKGVFSTSLSEEYYLAAQTFELSKRELWELSLTAVNYIFEDDSTKECVRKLWTMQRLNQEHFVPKTPNQWLN